MPDIIGREIFAVGTWNGESFTEEDLDDIVANFETLKEIHKVPLKFGHNKKQPMTDGQPAIGWVTRVYKQGQKLLADFSDVPNTVANAIKKKAYRTVSIELLLNVKRQSGQFFKNVLDAVALLGADHPAVNSLSDLDALLASRTGFTGGQRVAFETIAGKIETIDYTEKDMPVTKEEIKALVDDAVKPFAAANAELTTKLDEANKKIAQFESEKADAEKQAAKDQIELARKNVKDVLDEAVKNMSLTPAFREVYEEQIGFSDDARVVEIDVDKMRKLFSVKKKGESMSFEREGGNESFDNPEDELFTLTRKNMASSGEKNFQAAFSATCVANPELHLAYLNSNGVKGS